MIKSKNLGGFITIPIPAPIRFPMSFETYKKEYGVDLTDILTDNPDNTKIPSFKLNKPIFTEDVDKLSEWLPTILPIVVGLSPQESEFGEQLQIIHGCLPDSGFYMQIDWVNKTLHGNEF